MKDLSEQKGKRKKGDIDDDDTESSNGVRKRLKGGKGGKKTKRK